MAAAALAPLPRYTGSDPAMRQWSEQLCSQLEIWNRSLLAPTGQRWTVNGTTDQRVIDPAVLTSIALVVQVLGTLVQDLSQGAPLSVR